MTFGIVLAAAQRRVRFGGIVCGMLQLHFGNSLVLLIGKAS